MLVMHVWESLRLTYSPCLVTDIALSSDVSETELPTSKQADSHKDRQTEITQTVDVPGGLFRPGHKTLGINRKEIHQN